MIESRLAQLSSAARDLVDVAATIGREFSSDLLAAAGDSEGWSRSCADWTSCGGAGSSASRAASPTTSATTRSARSSYLALGPARRRQLHLQVAAALERSHAADLGSVGAQLASHYDRAGGRRGGRSLVRERRRGGATAPRGRRGGAFARAGSRACARTSPRSARPRRARARVAHRPPRAARGGRGLSVGSRDRRPRARPRMRRSARRRAGGAARPLARACRAWPAATSRPRATFGEQLRARGEREEDDVLWVESAYVLGVAAYWQGRLEAARAHFEAAVERCRPEQWTAHLLRYAQDPEVICLTRLAHTLWLSATTRSRSTARDVGLELADDRGHPYSVVVARHLGGGSGARPARRAAAPRST